MDFARFEEVARAVFREIPAPYRRGVDGLEVSRATVAHPSLPEVYTLGECRSEHYPSEFGGAGEVRSIVVLYYGSFLALSALDEAWDWEGEIFETVTHEVRHHLESLADEDALEELDYAEDQNFARREGETFDPFFYRLGIQRGEGVWEVDGDVFLETPVDPADAAGVLRLEWEGRPVRVRRPDPLGDIHFLRLPGAEGEGGEVFAVLLRRAGWWERLASLLRPHPPELIQTEAEVEEEWSDGSTA